MEPCGAAPSFQDTMFASAPVSGTRTLYPTSPCRPAGVPVPNDAIDSAVVDGNSSMSSVLTSSR